ncbi:MAG: hypothetical protein D4R50_04525 [Actinomycetales bacterium]|nr:MAG: hypothetical protein D4R50_04525 [Actinomycetales bacterium]
MAITSLIPSVASTEILKSVKSAKSARGLLNLVPELGTYSASRINSRKFLLIIVSIVTLNLLVVAGINILMTQDAFTLAHLKRDRNIALDQRDALLRELNSMTSPNILAEQARKNGMIPAVEVKYIDLSVHQ